MSEQADTQAQQSQKSGRAPTTAEVVFRPGPFGAILLSIAAICVVFSGVEDAKAGFGLLMLWLLLWAFLFD